MSNNQANQPAATDAAAAANQVPEWEIIFEGCKENLNDKKILEGVTKSPQDIAKRLHQEKTNISTPNKFGRALAQILKAAFPGIGLRQSEIQEIILDKLVRVPETAKGKKFKEAYDAIDAAMKKLEEAANTDAADVPPAKLNGKKKVYLDVNAPKRYELGTYTYEDGVLIEADLSKCNAEIGQNTDVAETLKANIAACTPVTAVYDKEVGGTRIGYVACLQDLTVVPVNLNKKTDTKIAVHCNHIAKILVGNDANGGKHYVIHYPKDFSKSLKEAAKGELVMARFEKDTGATEDDLRLVQQAYRESINDAAMTVTDVANNASSHTTGPNLSLEAKIKMREKKNAQKVGTILVYKNEDCEVATHAFLNVQTYKIFSKRLKSDASESDIINAAKNDDDFRKDLLAILVVYELENTTLPRHITVRDDGEKLLTCAVRATAASVQGDKPRETFGELIAQLYGISSAIKAAIPSLANLAITAVERYAEASEGVSSEFNQANINAYFKEMEEGKYPTSPLANSQGFTNLRIKIMALDASLKATFKTLKPHINPGITATDLLMKQHEEFEYWFPICTILVNDENLQHYTGLSMGQRFVKSIEEKGGTAHLMGVARSDLDSTNLHPTGSGSTQGGSGSTQGQRGGRGGRDGGKVDKGGAGRGGRGGNSVNDGKVTNPHHMDEENLIKLSRLVAAELGGGNGGRGGYKLPTRGRGRGGSVKKSPHQSSPRSNGFTTDGDGKWNPRKTGSYRGGGGVRHKKSQQHDDSRRRSRSSEKQHQEADTTKKEKEEP